MSTTFEASVTAAPADGNKALWITGSLSMVLMVFAVVAPVPVPLVAWLAMVFGCLGLRAARRHPGNVVAHFMAHVGLCGGAMMLALTAALTLAGATTVNSYG